MHKGIDIDIESLRAQLEAHRQELLILLTAASASTEPVELDQQIQGRLSRMDALQVQAMAQATNDRRRIEIAQIDAALARMAAGQYGYCVECGEEILTKRLQLNPAIAQCLECAS